MSLAISPQGSRLCVLLDVRSPFAYLALGPAAALGRELGVAIDWLPIRVPPLRAPSPPAPGDDRGIRHRRHRARALAREIETYAPLQGLVIRAWYRDPDPAALEFAWLWVRARLPDRLPTFLASAFRAYWALELDPSSAEQVAAHARALGADALALASWCASEGPAAAGELARELRERGLSGCPCDLVEDEVFYGRQHLPMIRWILEGRCGAVPI